MERDPQGAPRCLNEIWLPAAIVQDRPTLSRPIARGVRQPRDTLNHLGNWAPSTMPRVPPTPRPPPRPTTRCAAHRGANAVPTWCRSVSTIVFASPEGWYSDYGRSPPPTHRTRTRSYTPDSTNCSFSTSPACGWGWIATPPSTDCRNAVACDVGDGPMTGPPKRLTRTSLGRGEAATDQRAPASRAIDGLNGDRPIKITDGCVDPP
jgi:hypothetical protein